MKKDSFLVGFILTVLIMPRYIDYILGKYSIVIDILRIALLFFVALVFFVKKYKVDKPIICFLIYIIYMVCCTFLRSESIIFVANTYITGLMSFIFIKMISESDNKNKYYSLFLNIIDTMLVINLLIILYNYIFRHTLFINFEFDGRFFLGSDNRFILYMLIQTVLYNYLYLDDPNNKLINRRMIIAIIINLLTLFIVWSAAALSVYILLVMSQLFFSRKNRKINVGLILGIIILTEILIVFFDIQNAFKFIIVDILHKNLDLSYRTFIWHKSISEITSNLNILIFGNGFMNLTGKFSLVVKSAMKYNITLSPIHLHNILLNNLYMGGIIGTCLYFNYIRVVINNIKNIAKKKLVLYNMYSIVIIAIFALLIFDVFELYAHYFIILSLLCYSFKSNKELVK